MSGNHHLVYSHFSSGRLDIHSKGSKRGRKTKAVDAPGQGPASCPQRWSLAHLARITIPQ